MEELECWICQKPESDFICYECHQPACSKDCQKVKSKLLGLKESVQVCLKCYPEVKKRVLQLKDETPRSPNASEYYFFFQSQERVSAKHQPANQPEDSDAATRSEHLFSLSRSRLYFPTDD